MEIMKYFLQRSQGGELPCPFDEFHIETSARIF